MASDFVGKIKEFASMSICDMKDSAKNITAMKNKHGVQDTKEGKLTIVTDCVANSQLKPCSSRRKLMEAVILDQTLNSPIDSTEFFEEQAMDMASSSMFIFLVKIVRQTPPKKVLQNIIDYAELGSYLQWMAADQACYQLHLSNVKPSKFLISSNLKKRGSLSEDRSGTTAPCTVSSRFDSSSESSEGRLSRTFNMIKMKCSNNSKSTTGNSLRRSSERKISPVEQSSAPFPNGLTVEVPENTNPVGVKVNLQRKFKRTKPNPRDPKYKEKVFFQEMEDVIFRKLQENPQMPNGTVDEAPPPISSLGKMTISPKLKIEQSTSLKTFKLENGGLSPKRSVARTPVSSRERSPYSFNIASPSRSRSRSTSYTGSQSHGNLTSPTMATPSKLISTSRDQLDWTCFVGGYFNTASREHKAHHLHQSAYNIKDNVIKKNYKYLIRPGRALPQRRNSTNSIPLYYCQPDGRPDTFAIMKVVCVCLHYQIIRGCELQWDIHPSYALFDDRAMRRSSDEPTQRDGTPQVPTLIDVYQFFKYIFKTAQLERDCIVMSIIYIDRLLTESTGKLKMCNTNWKSVILAGMILASKVWDDLSMWNCDFSEVGRLNLKRINQLEAALLHAVQFNVRVPASLYARYHYHLRSWCVRFGIGASQEKRRASDGCVKTDLDLRGVAVSKSEAEELEVMFGVMKRKCKKPADTLAALEEVVDCACTHPDGRAINPMSVYEYRFQRQVTANLDPQELLQSLITLEEGSPEKNYIIKSAGPKNEGELLGVGLSGVVQQVEHRKSGMKYAMKTLYLGRMIDCHRVEELRNEIDIMSHLNHPNIARLIEVYEVPGEDRLSLIVELCTGSSLHQRLREMGHFAEAQCAAMVKKMLSAVRHIHSNGIIHRDLNLENWLFESSDEQAELKLIDFGLSRHFCKGEVLHLPIGTPYTMAPEVLQGSYNERCDNWSIGVITYMLLFGQQPFKGEDEYNMFKAIKKGEWEMPTHQPSGRACTPDALDFVKRLLVVDPSMRISSQDALRHPWLTRPRKILPQSSGKEVLELLQSFHQLSALMKLIYNVIAYVLEAAQLENIRQQFETLDVDCDGELSMDDLLQSLQGIASEEEIQQIFHQKGLADMDLSAFHSVHRIRYNDYLAANVRPQVAGLPDAQLRAIFDKLDRTGSGNISHDDIREFFGEQMTEEEINSELEDSGLKAAGGSSQIEYNQFSSALRKGGILSK